MFIYVRVSSFPCFKTQLSSPYQPRRRSARGKKYSLVHSHCVQLTLRPPLQFKYSPNMASTNFSCFLKRTKFIIVCISTSNHYSEILQPMFLQPHTHIATTKSLEINCGKKNFPSSPVPLTVIHPSKHACIGPLCSSIQFPTNLDKRKRENIASGIEHCDVIHRAQAAPLLHLLVLLVFVFVQQKVLVLSFFSWH